MTGDWELAEDCTQDAFAAALERWPRDGVPRRPGAWRLASHTGGPDARRDPRALAPALREFLTDPTPARPPRGPGRRP
ncbi:sigma factor [Nonomuraea guangzhouensis]|uniref:Sigma factor n=1 Tax=Nonomuraea guangzhouensis TaxID=1291555 RepID=A0ABW4GU52_9ACTN|nr:sigma factor [Nonomuraea guangzhouensis]